MFIENYDSCLVYEIKLDFDFICSSYRNKIRYSENLDDINKLMHLNKKYSGEELKLIGKQVDKLFNDDIHEYVRKAFCADELFEIIKTNGSSKDSVDDINKNLLSYSFYFKLLFIGDVDDINVSQKVIKRIKNVLIKFSTHLTKKQEKDLFGYNSGMTSYFIELPYVYEQRIRKSLRNIYNNYIDFMVNMSNDSNYYEDFNDIPEKVRNLLTEYAKQNID